jgi:hemolysin III
VGSPFARRTPEEALLMVREYRIADIIANSVTHGVGAVLALGGAIVLMSAAMGGTAWQVASCSVFGSTLVLVYVCSTLYHSLVRTRARHVLRIIDHSAIYLLIAGTYTPFVLVSLHGRSGWLLFAIVWGLAVMGIVFKSFAVDRFAIASAVVYLVMGWLVVFAMRPLLHALTWHGIFWIALGGLFYTVGIIFYAFDRFSYFHALWHVFVLSGSTCHYFAVLFYVAQPRT